MILDFGKYKNLSIKEIDNSWYLLYMLKLQRVRDDKELLEATLKQATKILKKEGWRVPVG